MASHTHRSNYSTAARSAVGQRLYLFAFGIGSRDVVHFIQELGHVPRTCLGGCQVDELEPGSGRQIVLHALDDVHQRLALDTLVAADFG